jgi:hypothetical protein
MSWVGSLEVIITFALRQSHTHIHISTFVIPFMFYKSGVHLEYFNGGGGGAGSEAMYNLLLILKTT